MIESDDASDEATSALLDPFVYFKGVSSKIDGLGGTTPRPEINYGFHTLYVRCAPGRCTMDVRISGLSATGGTLILQVNMLSVVPGSQARIAMIERYPFTELAVAGGRASVQFESLRGQIYALYGKIEGETDAAATELVVELDRLGKEEDELDPTRDIRPVSSAAPNIRPAERLVSTEPASFADPVSQCYTASQTREPAYRARARDSGERDAPSAAQWSRLYPKQVLHRYGLLQAGARGVYVTTGDIPADESHGLSGCRIEHRRVADLLDSDPAPQGSAREPDDYFDFLWTDLLGGQFDVATGLLAFAEQLMPLLRPRGLAVVMVRIVRTVDATAAWSVDAALGRGDIERLALNLMSYNHEVAQIRFSGEAASTRGGSRASGGSVPFGIIARRR